MSNNNKKGAWKLLKVEQSRAFSLRCLQGNAAVLETPASRPCVSGRWNISVIAGVQLLGCIQALPAQLIELPRSIYRICVCLYVKTFVNDEPLN